MNARDERGEEGVFTSDPQLNLGLLEIWEGAKRFHHQHSNSQFGTPPPFKGCHFYFDILISFPTSSSSSPSSPTYIDRP